MSAMVDTSKMKRAHLIGYVESLIKERDYARNIASKLRSLVSKAERALELSEAGDSMSGNYVIFDKHGVPSCSEHGVMLCMDKPRGMWRCPTCHAGISTHELLRYVRREWDGVLVIK